MVQEKYIVFITTKWGVAHGGINSFNTDFCKILGMLVKEPYKVVCAVEEFTGKEQSDAHQSGVELIEIGKLNDKTSIDTIMGKDIDKYENTAWWVGHDAISGKIANQGKNRTKSKSIIFQHMAYSRYYTAKTGDGDEAHRREEIQREIAKNADVVLGIGPYLSKYARYLKGTSPVIVEEIIPGLTLTERESAGSTYFNGIIIGRLSKHDDIIKNSKLATKAFCSLMHRIPKELNIDSNLTLIGLSDDKKQYDEELEEIELIVQRCTTRRVNVIPQKYSDDRENIFKQLSRQNVAFMLSLHEGFGLAGWEAIGAGIPLVISEESGLYEFLKESHPEILHRLYPVAITGSEKEKIDKISDKLFLIEKDREKAFDNAQELKKFLIQKNYTWEKAVYKFAEMTEIPIKGITPLNSPPDPSNKKIVTEGIKVKETIDNLKLILPTLDKYVHIVSNGSQTSALDLPLMDKRIDTISNCTKRTYHGSKETIEEVIKLFRDWMLNGTIVRLIGVGRAKLAGSIAANRLAHGGARIYIQDDLIPMPHSITGGGIIAVSASGETPSVLKILKDVQEKSDNITVVGIADKNSKKITGYDEFEKYCKYFIGIDHDITIDNNLQALADIKENVICLLLDAMVVAAGKLIGYDNIKWGLGHEDLGQTGPYNPVYKFERFGF